MVEILFGTISVLMGGGGGGATGCSFYYKIGDTIDVRI